MDAETATPTPGATRPSVTELPATSDDNSARWHVWVFAAVVVGIVARTTRYLLRFPLWEDECFLCANLMDRSFSELTTALDYRQCAPAAYLMVQKGIVSVFGFNEYSLRLVAFLAGIASLLLFWRLASRLLTGVPYVLAVTWFAASYPLIRYSAEAKPYGCDVLISLALLYCVVEWLQQPAHTRWLWRLAMLAPVAVAFSYASVFVAGGISLAIALAWLVRRSEARHVANREQKIAGPADDRMPGFAAVVTPWLLFNVAVAVAFLAVLTTTAGAQTKESMDWLLHAWRQQGGFPPIYRPWRLPGWLAWVHTGELLAYPLGSHGGGSTITFLACASGIVWLFRRRLWPLCALACVPLALNLLAAAMHRYPYGGQVRLSLYHAPWFCLLAGLGVAACLTWLQQWKSQARWHDVRVRLAMCALLVVPALVIGRDIAYPYKARSDQQARDFARWFWSEAPGQCEAVCLRTDLKQEFHPEILDEMSWTSMYLCNQRIYSPRHAAGRPPAWDQVTAKHPLWCLDFVPDKLERDSQAETAWLATMQERYELVGEVQFPFVRRSKQEERVLSHDYVKVWQFKPRGEVTAARGTAHDAPARR